MKFGFVITFVLLVVSLGARGADFPDWTLTPPSDDRLWFYSVGSGTDANDARTSALAELTSRLAVTVQSTSQQFVSSSNNNQGQASADFYLDIDTKQKSNQYSFNRVEVLRQFYDETHKVHYVLARINKDVFFEQLHSQLLTKIERLKPTNDFTNNTATDLEKLIRFNWQKRSIVQDLAVLKAYQQDVEQIDLALNIMEREFTELANNTQVNLISSNTAELAELKRWLNQAGFNISTKTQSAPLTLFVTSINDWQGQDQFQYANKQDMQLVFVYQGQKIHQQSLSAIAFANEGVVANTKATQLLNKQLNTN